MSPFYVYALAALVGASLPINAQQVARAQQSAASWNGVTLHLKQVAAEHALTEVARQTGLRLVVREQFAPLSKLVTVNVQNVSVEVALQRVMQGTGAVARVTPDGRTIVVERSTPQPSDRRVQGSITGRVTDAKTGRSVMGATVTLDGETRGVVTDEQGAFRLTNVVVGARTIQIRMIGYAKQTRVVTVDEGATATADFVLEASASVLDQMVVTGTIVQTELKAVPSAITVVTGKELEERGITRIDQLFRGDIPGLFAQSQGSGASFDEVVMFSRGATALSNSSAGISSNAFGAFLTNPIKTYVDGVELADPKYLSQIDPRSIERIEILTGPQASTIYGSNALNGVMQVFTKRGSTSRPQLTLNLLSGWIENNFSQARTPQHDYSGQVNGVEGRLSYNAGGSWTYVGPWTPAKQLMRVGSFGGGRLELPTPVGRMTFDASLRRGTMRNRQRGDDQQTVTGYREDGWYSRGGSAVGLSIPTTYTLGTQTLGLSLEYVPTTWWSHEMGLGQDVSDAERRYVERGYLFISDTTLLLQQTHTERRSFRYATTMRFSIAAWVQGLVTAGADAWQNLATFVSVLPQTLTGSLTGTTSVSRQPGHNAGSFAQFQVGLKDRLFVTYGLRAEWNPGFGAEAQPAYAPRYGAAYTQEMGNVTAKVRASYGRSTRPPQPKFKVPQSVVDFSPSLASALAPFYGTFDISLANPELAPEHQQGGEGGVEFYWGTRGSLIVTRYNQTVDGLISNPVTDSVRSRVLCPVSTCSANSYDASGYGYYGQRQYLNIGSIRNQGWELQGLANLGPITTRGTYSWTKSRTIGVNPAYRAQFANQPQYLPGATFRYLPEHTWAFGMTYARTRTMVGVNMMGVGRLTNLSDDLFHQRLNAVIRLPQNRQNVSNTGQYISSNAGYALTDITASYRFAASVEGMLNVQNLTDHYTNDFYGAYASMGRQAKLGLRLRLQ